MGRRGSGKISLRFVKKIRGRGLMCIPSDVCRVLALEPGDIVEMEVVGVIRRNAGSGLDPVNPLASVRQDLKILAEVEEQAIRG